MEAVELVERHEVDGLFHLGHAEEVARAVEMETAPTEARSVADLAGRHLLSLRDLSEGGDGRRDASVVVALDGDARFLYCEAVGPFALHALAVDLQQDVALAATLGLGTHPREALEAGGEVVGGWLERLVAVCDSGLRLDGKLTLSPGRLCGFGHEAGLSLEHRAAEQEQQGAEEESGRFHVLCYDG